MLLARQLALYRVAALVADKLFLPDRRNYMHRAMPSALDPGSYRLALSACPSGMLQDLAPYSTAARESEHLRSILLFHECIERLRYCGPVGTQQEDPLRPIEAAIRQLADVASPSLLDRALDLLVAKSSGRENGAETALRVLNVFARTVPPCNQLRLLEQRKALVGAFDFGPRYSIVPTPEGLATVALFVSRETIEGHVQGCFVVTLRDAESEAIPTLSPSELYDLPSGSFSEWEEDAERCSALSSFTCYYSSRTASVDTEVWKRDSGVIPKTEITADNLSRIAEVFEQLCSLPQVQQLVLTHGHILRNRMGVVSPFTWVDRLGQLIGKACMARSDGQGSVLIDVPQQNDWVWRVGHVAIASVGLSWLVDQSEDSRITRPASQDVGDWAASNLAQMAARSLTGAQWWSKPPPVQAQVQIDDEKHLQVPRVVRDCVSRLSAFKGLAGSGADNSFAPVGLVLCARTDDALMSAIFQNRSVIDRAGARSLILSKLVNRVIRADEGLVDIFIRCVPHASQEIDVPLRRGVAAYRALYRHVLALKQYIDDIPGKTSFESLVEGAAVACLCAQLRTSVLESTTDGSDFRLLCREHASTIGAWALEGSSLLHVNIEESGGAIDAVTALAERFDLSRRGSSSIRSYGEFSKITPLGWAVLYRLSMLYVAPVLEFDGLGTERSDHGVWQALSDAITPVQNDYPLGYFQSSTHWNTLGSLDEGLRVLTENELLHGIFVKVGCEGRNPVMTHGRDSVDVLSENGDEWQLDTCQFMRASLFGEKPTSYERYRAESGPWRYQWSESWRRGRLVGASMVSSALGKLLNADPGSSQSEKDTSNEGGSDSTSSGTKGRAQ
jgi:hypothetical protein